MNKHKEFWTLILSIIFLSSVGPVGSQTTVSGDTALKQIAWMIGGTWVAESIAADGS